MKAVTMNEQANILLVEDEKGSRVILTALLEGEGYHVSACETSEAALKHIMARSPTWLSRT